MLEELNESQNMPEHTPGMDDVIDQTSYAPAALEDPSELRVRGQDGENKPYIKTLAHAALTVVSKYGHANLKCVGASAINNAMKAIVIASGDAKKKGINLVVSPSFQEAEFKIEGVYVKKTAMMLTIYDR